jgi:PAS domain-containing protein
MLPEDSSPIQNVTLSLFSIIMLNSANAIESSELYRTIREINSNLERIDNYRILFEAAPDGVEVLDAAGQIVDSNDFQKKLIGYHQEDLLGTHTSDYFSESNRHQFVNNYCPPRGLGEKPSPSGEDFSMFAAWSTIENPAILYTTSNITLFGSRNTASRF